MCIKAFGIGHNYNVFSVHAYLDLNLECCWMDGTQEEDQMIEQSKRYKGIGERLLQHSEFDEIRESGVRIAWLASDKEKITNRKRIFADCRKVSDHYKWTCPYDFMITVYEPNCIALNREQMRILLMHELHHIGIAGYGIEPSFYLNPHDVEEFDTIIERYGTHWEE